MDGNRTAGTPGLYAIVAMGRGNEIGFKGDMPWHLPEDLRHFRQLTTGHPVIMGRATWESLPKRPLPGRRNIVLSRNTSFQPIPSEGFVTTEGTAMERASGLSEALEMCRDDETPFIIGGGKVYAEAMPLVTKIFVTRIDADFPDADTFFPTLDGFILTDKSEDMISRNGLSYRFETYESSNNKQV